MSSSSDDKGLGGEGKRPYATIDLKATQVDEKTIAPETTAAGDKPANAEAAAPTPEDATSTEPPKATAPAAKSGGNLFTHMAAGLVGAVAVLGVSQFVLTDREEAQRQSALVKQLSQRITELEGAVGGKPGAEGMRARLDDLARTATKLGEQQGQLTALTRALDQRVGGQEIPANLGERLTKIDEILATVPTPAAGREPSPAAKALITRVDGELSALRTETGRLSQRIDTLKGEVQEQLKGAARASDVTPLQSKVAAMEKDVQGFTRSEADRNANASRIVLLLELGNLKRALDAGAKYPAELAAVQKVSGGKLNLAPLQRYVMDGVPPVTELQKSFRRVANQIIDAEGEPSDASLVDRLVNGAKSVVRVRKQGHAADDTSVEATVGRMEVALKESRLGEVLAQAKKLPPKAALAGEDWLKKVEARQAVDAAIGDIEQTLKTSLGEAQR